MQQLFEFQASQVARATADIAGPLLALKVDLMKMPPIAITPSTVVGDLTAKIADYEGYAQGTVTWDDPSLDANGAVEVVGTAIVYRPTGDATPNQIWGAFCRASVGGALLFAGSIDGAPIPMNTELNQLQVQIVYKPATGTYTITVI